MNRGVHRMDGNKFLDCKRCDGQGILFEDDGAEIECPVCEGEGGEFENYRQLIDTTK